jgi:hypothetical protein
MHLGNFYVSIYMKKIMCAVLGALAITANANAYDVNNKFYAGITGGLTYSSYKSSFNDGMEEMNITFKKNGPNAGILIGKGFGAWGLELNGMLLSYRKSTMSGSAITAYQGTPASLNGSLTMKLTDWMAGLDGYYNFFRNERWTARVLFGVAGIKSKISGAAQGTITVNGTSHTVSYTDSETLKARMAVKAGIGGQFAFNSHLAMTAAVNYVKPISHQYMTNIVFATVGLNVYF